MMSHAASRQTFSQSLNVDAHRKIGASRHESTGVKVAGSLPFAKVTRISDTGAHRRVRSGLYVGAHRRKLFSWGPCERCQRLKQQTAVHSGSLGSQRLHLREAPPGTPSQSCLRRRIQPPNLNLNQRKRAGQTSKPRAILDFDWSDSPRGWSERASTFIPPGAPDPVKFQRKRLNLKFAVLLMRSSYEAVDELDFIAMDKFQIKVRPGFFEA